MDSIFSTKTRMGYSRRLTTLSLLQQDLSRRDRRLYHSGFSRGTRPIGHLYVEVHAREGSPRGTGSRHCSADPRMLPACLAHSKSEDSGPGELMVLRTGEGLLVLGLESKDQKAQISDVWGRRPACPAFWAKYQLAFCFFLFWALADWMVPT